MLDCIVLFKGAMQSCHYGNYEKIGDNIAIVQINFFLRRCHPDHSLM